MHKAPSFITDFDLQIPHFNKLKMDNGVPLYSIKQKGIGIVKLDIQIIGGRPFESQKGVAQACGALLKSGTKNYSNAQIDEAFDLKGATLITRASLDAIIIEVHCLTKYLKDLLPILEEIYFLPQFPQEEINKYISRKKEELAEDMTQNEYLSYRELTEHVFGKDHPYGYNSTPEVYDALQQKLLVKHHKSVFKARQTSFFMSGDFESEDVDKIKAIFGKIPLGEYQNPRLEMYKNRSQKVIIKNVGTTQSALKTGWLLFNKKHPDFNKMYVVNTILGGYFGGRLMMNIRETKGLTYSIYSSLDTMLLGGYMWIDTELSHENVEAALKEIKGELDLLKSKLVGHEELEMVKSYLQGTLLTMLDGAFNQIEVLKAYVLEGMSVSAFGQLINTIKTIQASDIQEMVQKHLSTEEMITVIAGNPK